MLVVPASGNKEIITTNILETVKWFNVTGFPGGSMAKNPPANSGDQGLGRWVGKIPWRKKWQPTPVFLPGKSHGERSLVGYSAWGPKEWTQQEEMVIVLSTGMALRTIHLCTPNCPEENIPRKDFHSVGNGEVLAFDGKGVECGGSRCSCQGSGLGSK